MKYFFVFFFILLFQKSYHADKGAFNQFCSSSYTFASRDRKYGINELKKIEIDMKKKTSYSFNHQFEAYQSQSDYFLSYLLYLLPHSSPVKTLMNKKISLAFDKKLHAADNFLFYNKNYNKDFSYYLNIMESILPLFLFTRHIANQWEKKSELTDSFDLFPVPHATFKSIFHQLQYWKKKYQYYMRFLNIKINYEQYIVYDKAIKNLYNTIKIDSLDKDVFEKTNFTFSDYIFHKIILMYYGELFCDDYNNEFLKKNHDKTIVNTILSNIDYKNENTQKKIAYVGLSLSGLSCGVFYGIKGSFRLLKFFIKQGLRIPFIQHRVHLAAQKLSNIDTGHNKLSLYFLLTCFFDFKNENNSFFAVAKRSYLNKKYFEENKKDYQLNDLFIYIGLLLNFDLIKMEDSIKVLFFVRDILINPSKMNHLMFVKFLKLIFGSVEYAPLSQEDDARLEGVAEELRNIIFNNKTINNNDLIKMNILNSDFLSQEKELLNHLNSFLWQLIFEPKMIGDWIINAVPINCFHKENNINILNKMIYMLPSVEN
jgi:hypothetical protein